MGAIVEPRRRSVEPSPVVGALSGTGDSQAPPVLLSRVLHSGPDRHALDANPGRARCLGWGHNRQRSAPREDLDRGWRFLRVRSRLPCAGSDSGDHGSLTRPLRTPGWTQAERVQPWQCSARQVALQGCWGVPGLRRSRHAALSHRSIREVSSTGERGEPGRDASVVPRPEESAGCPGHSGPAVPAEQP